MSEQRFKAFASIALALETLPMIMVAHRRARSLTRDEVGRQMGVCKDTVARIEAGDGITAATAMRAFRWLAGGDR